MSFRMQNKDQSAFSESYQQLGNSADGILFSEVSAA